MRDFTPEEKELIVNTPITIECFDFDNFEDVIAEPLIISGVWKNYLFTFETVRQKYNETKDEQYFIELVRLLPNSYKVVKL